MHSKFLTQARTVAMSLVAAAALAACGGGGGDDVVTKEVNVPVHVAGVAATGLVLPNADVSIQCALPRTPGTTKTDTNGRYSFTFEADVDSAGPCIVSITPQPTAANPNPTPLTSITKASTGTELVANVTPLTTALVTALLNEAKASGKAVTNPADLVDAAKGAVPQNIGEKMAAVVAAIRSTLPEELKALLPEGTDLLADTAFTPATTLDDTSAAVSSVDKLLDVLAGRDVKIVNPTTGVEETVAGLPPEQQLINPATGVVSDTVVEKIVENVQIDFSNVVGTPTKKTITVTGGSGL